MRDPSTAQVSEEVLSGRLGLGIQRFAENTAKGCGAKREVRLYQAVGTASMQSRLSNLHAL